MIDLWTVLLPILLVDALNPVLFAFVVYAVGTERPFSNGAAALAGHTLAYFLAGIAIALGLDRLSELLENPGALAFSIEAVLGGVLLFVAAKSVGGSGASPPTEGAGALTPLSAFGLGMVINFVGIPFAVPYFAALDQILKVDLDTAGAVLQLAIYNAGYALPFLALLGIRAALGDEARPVLERINDVVERASGFVMPPLLGLAGIALLIDAGVWFATGDALFP
jgi:cytochrome c biogenesis protein CcdA